VELADTSAWTNRHRDAAVRADFDARVRHGEIAMCSPVLMELLWSARNPGSFDDVVARMGALPQLAADRPVWERAVVVWRELVGQGRHRQAQQFDLLVAAAAELAGVGVCHYDRHFDVIAEVTGQPVRAIAPLGSLARA
jgi:predicted nucleic acid-binding protein